jgi:hypothetical protein
MCIVNKIFMMFPPSLGMNGLQVSPTKMSHREYLTMMMICGIMLDKPIKQSTILPLFRCLQSVEKLYSFISISFLTNITKFKLSLKSANTIFLQNETTLKIKHLYVVIDYLFSDNSNRCPI